MINILGSSTSQEWELNANEFESKWNFPNCISAIDGKHISIRNQTRSGSCFLIINDFIALFYCLLMQIIISFM